jgi:cytoskeleton protein RodZ
MIAMIAEQIAETATPLAAANDEPVAPPRASIGMRLAAARIAKGVSVEAAHFGTKVKIPYLIAIEAGDRAALPATPFAAGFVKSYAQFLGLPADATARDWRAEMEGFAPPAPLPAPEPKPAPIVLMTPIKAPAAPIVPRMPHEAPNDAGPAPTPAQSLFVAPPLKTTLLVSVAAIAVFAYFGAQAQGRKTREAERSAALEERMSGPAVAAPSMPEPQISATTGVALIPPTEKAAPPETKTAERPVAESDQAQTQKAEAPAPRLAPRTTGPSTEAALAVSERTPAAETPTGNEIAPATLAPNSDGAQSEAPVIDASMDVSVIMSSVVAAPAEPVEAEETSALADAAPKFTAALLLKPPRLIYPDRCSAKSNATESVTVSYSVGVDGAVSGVKAVSSTNACFEAAAIAAASKMRFAPALVGGAPTVEAGRTATLQFRRE